MKILAVVLVSLICSCMPININNIDFVSEQQVNSNLNAVADMDSVYAVAYTDTGCELKRIIRNTNEHEVIDKGYEIKNLAIYNENLYYVLCDGDNHTESIIKYNKNSLKRRVLYECDGLIKGVAVSDNVYFLDNEGALNKLHDSNEEKLFENVVAFGIYGTNIYYSDDMSIYVADKNGKSVREIINADRIYHYFEATGMVDVYGGIGYFINLVPYEDELYFLFSDSSEGNMINNMFKLNMNDNSLELMDFKPQYSIQNFIISDGIMISKSRTRGLDSQKDRTGIFTYNLNTGEKKSHVAERGIISMGVFNDKIYYEVADENMCGHIYEMNVDGSGIKELS